MIYKFSFNSLRNAEYNQFMRSVHDILVRLEVDRETFGSLINMLSDLLQTAETSLTAERRNEKVREKNEADRYRDRLHSKLFNHLKSILCDEMDSRFDNAQTVMKVVKEAGNPTQLSENAQSTMMTALGAKLEPFRTQLEAIGAQTIVDDMMEANRRFIAIEIEYRSLLAAQQLDGTPTSMSGVRKQIDPIYRALVNAINGYCGIPDKREEYRETVAELNILATRYDAILAARKREKKEKHPVTCDDCNAEI